MKILHKEETPPSDTTSYRGWLQYRSSIVDRNVGLIPWGHALVPVGKKDALAPGGMP